MALLWALGLALVAGVYSATSSDRIVGGSPANVEQYPSIVQIDTISLFSPVWNQGCGGSIITNFHVVSAAHCFDPNTYEINERRIRAGSSLRNTGGILVYLQSVFNHPSYIPNTNSNDGDITVLRLTNPLVWSNVIQPIAITQQGTVLADNLPVVHAGWGRTEFIGDPSDVLLDVTVYTINNAVCSQRYESSYTITENMICAGILDVGGRDACTQDSGGPMYFNSNNVNILVGVISFGINCAHPLYPGVSTRVASYTDWIIATAV